MTTTPTSTISLVDVFETLHDLITQAEAVERVTDLALSVDTEAAREVLHRVGAQLDTESSNSRQYYIETGEYQTIAEAFSFRV